MATGAYGGGALDGTYDPTTAGRNPDAGMTGDDVDDEGINYGWIGLLGLAGLLGLRGRRNYEARTTTSRRRKN